MFYANNQDMTEAELSITVRLLTCEDPRWWHALANGDAKLVTAAAYPYILTKDGQRHELEEAQS